MLHYKRKLCCPALWMLPLGNESVGIYSRFSLPLAKRSAGITWMGLAVKQSPLWLHGCRAAALFHSASSRWVCMWEYKAHGNHVLLAKQDCSQAILPWEGLEEKPRSRQQLADPACPAVMLSVQCCSLTPEDAAYKGKGREAVEARCSLWDRSPLVPLTWSSTAHPGPAQAEVADCSPPQRPIE